MMYSTRVFSNPVQNELGFARVGMHRVGFISWKWILQQDAQTGNKRNIETHKTACVESKECVWQVLVNRLEDDSRNSKPKQDSIKADWIRKLHLITTYNSGSVSNKFLYVCFKGESLHVFNSRSPSHH